MKINAVIFDLDGTVIASEDQWGEAFNRVLRRLGVESDSIYPHQGGIGIEENWPIFIRKYNIKTDKSVFELGVETIAEYYKLIPKVTLKEGFLDLVQELRKKDIKIALATSSTWEITERVFDSLDIEKYFDSVTTGEEVIYKKPDPAIFQIACEKLGVLPENAVVFEDSSAGVAAAVTAGLKVVAIARNKNQILDLKNADMIIDDFSSVKVEDLDKLGKP